MAQDIGQADDVPLLAVIDPGEEMPQIMRKDLFSAHPGGGAEFFHF